jgi:hypothetical protein
LELFLDPFTDLLTLVLLHSHNPIEVIRLVFLPQDLVNPLLLQLHLFLLTAPLHTLLLLSLLLEEGVYTPFELRLVVELDLLPEQLEFGFLLLPRHQMSLPFLFV